MTYSEFKAYAMNYSPCKSNEERAFEADTMIMHFAHLKKSDLLLKRCEEVQIDILNKLVNAVNRRSDNEPLQYIIGEWEFYGLRIFCGEGCLIPRPETEFLCDIAIKSIPLNGHFLDLCTGSSCISCAILNNRPDVTGTGVDISENALKYARKNIRYHNLENRFEIIEADVCEFKPIQIPDVIVSNPPYIKTEDLKKLEKELYFEPCEALDGGHDGLDFYKIISKRYKNRFLKDNGMIIFEVGYDIPYEVEAVLKYDGFKTKVCNDIYGVERVVIGQKQDFLY